MVSRIGTPINKFVRIGLTVKVCILINQEKECPPNSSVWVDGERVLIEIETPQSRAYVRKPEPVKVWKPLSQPFISLEATTVVGNDN